MALEEPDYLPISAEGLGIPEAMRVSIIEMMLKNGLVSGVTRKRYIQGPLHIINFSPRITLKGLDYLKENSMMHKAAEVAKGVIDIIT